MNNAWVCQSSCPELLSIMTLCRLVLFCFSIFGGAQGFFPDAEKAAKELGNSAKIVADSTAKTMESVRHDVNYLRTYFVSKVWPSVRNTLGGARNDSAELKTVLVKETLAEVNSTLQEFRRVLNQAEGLIVRLAPGVNLLIFLCAALVCRKISSNIRDERTTHGSVPVVWAVLAYAELSVVQFVYWTCNLVVILSVFHMIKRSGDMDIWH